METILIGFFSGYSYLKTKSGRKRLTPIPIESSKEPFSARFEPARERENILAVVKGNLNGNILHGAKLIEVAPPLLSFTLNLLLKSKELSWDDLEDKLEKSKKIIIGPATPTPSRDNKPLCALVVGHRKSAKGACSKKFDICEFDLNSDIADLVKTKVIKAKIKIIFRDNATNGYTKLPAKINKHNPHFIVSLHCNAATPRANGTEMLYFHTSKKSHKIAKIMQKKVLEAYGFRNRGTKAKRGSDRGGSLLKNTKAPCIIAEPFFISNNQATEEVLASKNKLAKVYAAGIDEIVTKMFT